MTQKHKKGVKGGMQGACRRRKKEESNNIEQIELIPRSRSNHRQPASSTPKSFEQQLYITMTRSAHRSAYFITYFISRLVGISQFCAIYSFTGMLFTVSVPN